MELNVRRRRSSCECAYHDLTYEVYVLINCLQPYLKRRGAPDRPNLMWIGGD